MPGPAFITGGSSGIGLEMAKRLADAGHGIALFARDAAKLQDAVRSVRDLNPDAVVTAHSVDVTDRAALELAVQAAIQAHGAPEWAIANAGIAEPGLFIDQPIESFELQMMVNYMGALYFTKALTRPMAENDGGKMVFVSSGAAFFGIYGYSAYAPTKFAMRGLAETLRVELRPHKITVTLAYPPDTDTPQLAAEAKTKPEATKEITAGAGVWNAQDVAKVILRRAQKGRFAATPGLQMRVLLALHSVIAPVLRLWQGRIVRKGSR